MCFILLLFEDLSYTGDGIVPFRVVSNLRQTSKFHRERADFCNEYNLVRNLCVPIACLVEIPSSDWHPVRGIKGDVKHLADLLSLLYQCVLPTQLIGR